MKRTTKSSLLTVTAAVAGLAMGAGIAMAHPSVPLYTYEEVAAQYGAPAMPVMVDPTSHQGFPYSPKQTCMGGGSMSCHTPGNGAGLKSYDELSKHAFHASLGFNEWMDNNPDGLFISSQTYTLPTGAGQASVTVNAGTQTGLNPQKPWLQSHGHNGKW
ncbi:MAG TPA: hypothetical protein VEM32_07175 [Geobacteraceae bacterium]|nr:hypothetical protein [Geobacteraceae bacterium]